MLNCLSSHSSLHKLYILDSENVKTDKLYNRLTSRSDNKDILD